MSDNGGGSVCGPARGVPCWLRVVQRDFPGAVHGLRIATGLLKIVADQKEAEQETERYIRRTDRRMAAGGRSSGLAFGRALAGGIASGFAGLLSGLLAMDATDWTNPSRAAGVAAPGWQEDRPEVVGLQGERVLRHELGRFRSGA